MMSNPTQPTADVAPAPKPTPRWIKPALVVSVALNLAIAGVVVGAILRGPPQRIVRELDFGPFTEALSPEDREALIHDFFRVAPMKRATMLDMRRDFDAIVAVLRTSPFDRDAMDHAMQRMGERLHSRLVIGQSLLLDRVAAMSDQDRRAFADRLVERARRFPHANIDGPAQND